MKHLYTISNHVKNSSKINTNKGIKYKEVEGGLCRNQQPGRNYAIAKVTQYGGAGSY